MDPAFQTLMKAHVLSHTRVLGGRVVYVHDYDSARPQGREARLHERVTVGTHNQHGPFIRATDAGDRGAITHAAERLGITPTLLRRAGANHHGRTGAYDHIHFAEAADAMRVHQVLGGETHKPVAPAVRLEIQEALFAEAELSVPRGNYPRPTIYCSGTNEAGYIHGFADAGIAVGVSLSHMKDDAIPHLIYVAKKGAPLFVDNGAFSEVSFPDENGPPVVTAPISDAEWDRRLDIYDRLAREVPHQLTAVAPDRIGDQQVTLQRLNRYKDRLQRLHNLGARVLLPVQRGGPGSLSQPEFYRAAVAILGFHPTPAFPMKKSATPPEDVVKFVREIQPRDIHLLGMGIQSSDAADILAGVHAARPGINVSMDSNLIKGAVGRKRRIEPLTAAQDQVRADMSIYGGIEDREMGEAIDYTEEISQPSGWSSMAARKRIAVKVGLTKPQTKRFKSDPDEFLQEYTDGDDSNQWWQDPQMEVALDAEWHNRSMDEASQMRKRASVPIAFGNHPAAGQFNTNAPARDTRTA